MDSNDIKNDYEGFQSNKGSLISVYKVSLEKLEKGNSNKEDNLNYISKQIKADNLKSKIDIKEKFVKKGIFKGYNTKFLFLNKNSTPDWIAYTQKFLNETIDTKRYPRYSAILLLENQNSKNIYILTFGTSSHHKIKRFIENDFGLDILSRIPSIEDLTLKSSKEQNVIGNVQAEQNVYRKNSKLHEIDCIGKVFQELHTKANDEILKYFNIGNNRDNNYSCVAKSSFQLKKSIKAQSIKNILDGLEIILKNPNGFMGGMKPLKYKDNITLYRKLWVKLINKVMNTLKNNSDCVDILHRDFDEYIKAEKYFILYRGNELELEGGDNSSFISKFIKNSSFTDRQIKQLLKKAALVSKENEIEKTHDLLINHFSDEEEINGRKFFFINGLWYGFEDTLLSQLDDKIKSYQKKGLCHESTYIKQWDVVNNPTEHHYINLYRSDKNTIIVHPDKYLNIELCDIINWDNNNLYLYFIKQGFEAKTRDLASQVYISARQIEISINSDKKFLIDCFDKCIKDKTNLSETEFISLFSKNIYYIFAFNDKHKRKLLDNPDSFGSNIAKMSLINLVSNMNELNKCSLRICQIDIK